MAVIETASKDCSAAAQTNAETYGIPEQSCGATSTASPTANITGNRTPKLTPYASTRCLRTAVMSRFTLRRDRYGCRDGVSVFSLTGRATASRSLSLLQKRLDRIREVGVEFHRRRRAAIRELHRTRVIANTKRPYAATINVAFKHLPIGASKSGSADALKGFSVIDSNLDRALGVKNIDLE